MLMILIVFSSYNKLVRKRYPKDNDRAFRAVRWAVLLLRVAPQGDF